MKDAPQNGRGQHHDKRHYQQNLSLPPPWRLLASTSVSHPHAEKLRTEGFSDDSGGSMKNHKTPHAPYGED
jgi:hypothetical protein